MSLFGEMFKSETATYAFDSVDNCQESSRVILVPANTSRNEIFNQEGATYLYWGTESVVPIKDIRFI